jgi:DNA primase
MLIDVEKVKQIPIESVVCNYTQLKRNGNRMVGKCPIHEDGLASFNIYLDTNTFHCFGCGNSGDVIKFVELVNGVDFKGAVDILCGNNVEYTQVVKREIRKERKFDLTFTKEVFKFILSRTQYISKSPALEYLIARGINYDTIKRMDLRYINDSNSLDRQLSSTFDMDDLKRVHLYNDSGKFVLHYHKLLFPYFYKDEPVFMQGRVIEKKDDYPSYMNIGETVPYPYNIDSVKGDICTIISEGVMDALTLMQEYPDVASIAVPGVHHMKKEWIDMLRGRTVIVVFDNDIAGYNGKISIKEKLEDEFTTVTELIVPEMYNDFNEYYVNRSNNG